LDIWRKSIDDFRRDLHRLGFLAVDDPLWALLEKKDQELDAAMPAEIDNLSKGTANE
jgi:hypothetical protein